MKSWFFLLLLLLNYAMMLVKVVKERGVGGWEKVGEMSCTIMLQDFSS